MKYLIILILLLSFDTDIYGQNALPSDPIDIEWGKGFYCTGRGICNIKNSKHQGSIEALLEYSVDGDAVQISIPKVLVPIKDATYYIDAQSIDVSKPVVFTINSSRVVIPSGSYKFFENRDSYIVELTTATDK